MTSILGLLIGIGKPTGPFIGHRTVTLGLIPGTKWPPTVVKLVIYLVKYCLQGVDIGYDVHPGSFNGHMKAYWAFYRAQDGHIVSYTGNNGPCTSYGGHPGPYNGDWKASCALYWAYNGNNRPCTR